MEAVQQLEAKKFQKTLHMLEKKIYSLYMWTSKETGEYPFPKTIYNYLQNGQKVYELVPRLYGRHK